MEVEILEEYFFRDITSQKFLNSSYYVLTTNIRKQLDHGTFYQVFYEFVEALPTNANTFSLTQIIISLFFKIPINALIGSIDILQLITFQTMQRLNLPPNVNFY